MHSVEATGRGGFKQEGAKTNTEHQHGVRRSERLHSECTYGHKTVQNQDSKIGNKLYSALDAAAK